MTSRHKETRPRARPTPQALLAQTAPSFECRAKGQNVAGEGAQRRTLRDRPATAKQVASRFALLERRSPKAISAGPVAIVGSFGARRCRQTASSQTTARCSGAARVSRWNSSAAWFFATTTSASAARRLASARTAVARSERRCSLACGRDARARAVATAAATRGRLAAATRGRTRGRLAAATCGLARSRLAAPDPRPRRAAARGAPRARASRPHDPRG